MTPLFTRNTAGGFSPDVSRQSEINAFCQAVVDHTGIGAEIRLAAGNSGLQDILLQSNPWRDDIRVEIEGPLGLLSIEVLFRNYSAPLNLCRWVLKTPADLLCLLARILIALDQAGLTEHHPKRPCRAPCGEGVFIDNGQGGLVARPEWQAGIDSLCSTIRQNLTTATVHFTPYLLGRALALDIVGQDRLFTFRFSISINPQGNPLSIEPEDLPALAFDDLQQPHEQEFWLANYADGLCLAARVLSTLDQDGELALAVSTSASSLGPSVKARCRK